MSRTKTKGDSLGPLQKTIILFLAKTGPQDISETADAIHGHYKSANVAFHSLEKKGLLKRVTEKEYRGQKYPRYWLTTYGIILALSNNANINKLKQITFKHYTDQDRVFWELFFEIAETMGSDTVQKIYGVIRTGEIKLEYFPINQSDLDKFLKIVSKHPKILNPILENLRKIQRYEGGEKAQ